MRAISCEDLILKTVKIHSLIDGLLTSTSISSIVDTFSQAFLCTVTYDFNGKLSLPSCYHCNRLAR